MSHQKGGAEDGAGDGTDKVRLSCTGVMAYRPGWAEYELSVCFTPGSAEDWLDVFEAAALAKQDIPMQIAI